MQTDYPELAISLRTSSPVGMIELLRRHEIDIVVDAEPRTTGDFISWPTYKDRFNFYVCAGGITKFDQESVKHTTLELMERFGRLSVELENKVRQANGDNFHFYPLSLATSQLNTKGNTSAFIGCHKSSTARKIWPCEGNQ